MLGPYVGAPGRNFTEDTHEYKDPAGIQCQG
jgi:hypothetical protein